VILLAAALAFGVGAAVTVPPVNPAGAQPIESVGPQLPRLDGLTWEEALTHDAMGHPGKGIVNWIPMVVVANEPNQELFLRVSNLSWTAGSWTLLATGDLLAAPFETTLSIEGCTSNEVATRVVVVPLVADPQEGEYQIELELRGVFDSQDSVDLFVVALTDEERAGLIDAARSGELGEEPGVVDEVIKFLSADATKTPPSGISETVWIPVRIWAEDPYSNLGTVSVDPPPSEVEAADAAKQVGGPGATARWLVPPLGLPLGLAAGFVVWRRRATARAVVATGDKPEDPTD
jgi:hypothetical protein